MKTLLFILVLFSLLTPALAFATDVPQGLVSCGNDINHNGILDPGETCQLCDLFQIVNNLINWVLLVIIPIVAPIFLVIGGIYLLIARGDPGMFTRGKDILQAAIVGLIIIYTAWVLLSTVLTFLGISSWTGLSDDPSTLDVVEGWWHIKC
jgi:hypothetical protein